MKLASLLSTLSSKAKKLKASANKREEREVEGSRRTRILPYLFGLAPRGAYQNRKF